ISAASKARDVGKEKSQSPGTSASIQGSDRSGLAKTPVSGYICSEGDEECALTRSPVGRDIWDLSLGSQTRRKEKMYLSTDSQTGRMGDRGLAYRQSVWKDGREGTCLQAVCLEGRERGDLSTDSQAIRKGGRGFVYKHSD
ncbi:hypothetical protein LSAT2_024462, partial [Lamellibrachia satsuma]